MCGRVIAASLGLLRAHAALFRSWLLREDDLLRLLSSLLAACRHVNSDVSRFAPSALEAFLMATVDALVQGDEDGHQAAVHDEKGDAPMKAEAGEAALSRALSSERRRLFHVLTASFRRKLDEQKSITEVALAIRAFGYLAKVHYAHQSRCSRSFVPW